MDLKLNIYENGTVKKTYTQNQYDITFGTIENFIALIDLDKFENVKPILTPRFTPSCSDELMEKLLPIFHEKFPEVK